MVACTRALMLLSLAILLIAQVSAQAPRRNARGRRRTRRVRASRNGGTQAVEIPILQAVEPGTPVFEAILAAPCSNDFRTIDGTCTNLRDRLLGSTLRPQLLPNGVSSATITRNDLPSARDISNAICKQTQDVFSSRGLSELFTFFGQFIDHNIVASPEGDERMNILISPSDPMFANFSAGLPFVRSERGLFEEGSTREGPINALPSALDLSAVYGADEERASLLRENVGGRMLVSSGNLLPFNTFGLFNAPSATAEFYVSGDHRVNEHPVLSAIHVIFLREHNRLARKLEAAFPAWDDEMLYQNARKVNGAQFQKIVYEEFYPAITGRRLRRFRRHDESVDPTVSALFSTAAFRIGHTLVGNVINRVGPNGAIMTPLDMASSFFRVQNIAQDGIEPYLIGAARSRAQETDNQIHNNLRDFLFTGLSEELGFDLAAINIKRGRDHGLPSFNDVRRQFNLRPYNRFSQITDDVNVQSALASVYTSVDLIDPWVGMIVEKHAPNASMGRTMLRAWRDEFTRLRDGDRFYYEIRSVFPSEIRRACPEIRRLIREPNTFKRIIIANSEATESDFTSERGIFFANA